MRERLENVVQRLYALVNQLEAVPAGGVPIASVRQRCAALLEDVQELKATIDQRRVTLRAALDRLSATLQESTYQLSEHPNVQRLRALKTRLSENYEGLLVTIRSHPGVRDMTSRLRSLRPRNYARNIFHVASALLGFVLYEWFLSAQTCIYVMCSVLAFYLGLEVVRRRWPRFNELLIDQWLSAIVRPRERHSIPAATLYAAAILILLLTVSKTAMLIGVLVLGLGDPAATLVGRRWGTTKLWRRKSMEGTAAFLVVGTTCVLAYLLLCRDFGLGASLLLATSTTGAGAIAEVLSDDWLDDNFTVPLVAGLMAAFIL